MFARTTVAGVNVSALAAVGLIAMTACGGEPAMVTSQSGLGRRIVSNVDSTGAPLTSGTNAAGSRPFPSRSPAQAGGTPSGSSASSAEKVPDDVAGPVEVTGRRVGDFLAPGAGRPEWIDKGFVDPSDLPPWLIVAVDDRVVGYLRTSESLLALPPGPGQPDPVWLIYGEELDVVGEYRNGSPVITRTGG